MQFVELVNQAVGEISVPNPRQIIFINQEQNSELEDFFQREYDNVVRLFKQCDLEFIFLPHSYTPERISSMIAYCHPEIPESKIQLMAEDFTLQSFYQGFKTERESLYSSPIFSDTFYGEHNMTDADVTEVLRTHHNGFVRYLSDDMKRPSLDEAPLFNPSDRWQYYELAELEVGSDEEMWAQIDEYLMHVDDSRYMEIHGNQLCSVSFFTVQDEDTSPDEKFPTEAFELINDIKEKLEALRFMGVNEMIIRNLLQNPNPDLSKMVITSDFKIILEDFQQKEIKMGPMPKAVFLLFLRHPEGIVFKHISDYYDEILALYLKVSGKELDAEIKASMKQLTDPFRNTLNENCSHIRRAFLQEFDDELAKYYYVTGERATPKQIRLPRNLVIYPDALDIPVTKDPLPRPVKEYESEKEYKRRELLW